MKRVLTIFAVTVLVLTASGSMLAQTTPFVGTWTLNVAKSTFGPGLPPKSETRTQIADGNGLQAIVQRINGDGSSQTFGYAPQNDGKDYPIMGQTPTMGPLQTDAIVINSATSNRIQSTIKASGKALWTNTYEVSEDGKVLTVTSEGRTLSDHNWKVVAVFDRQ